MGNEKVLYICPICFRTCETEEQCHTHQMIACNIGDPGDERRKPVKDRFGRYVSRAPRWYLESIGWIQTK